MESPSASSQRFCNSCKKSVWDMEEMSPEQLKSLFAASGGKLCGRFYAEDLDAAPRFQGPQLPGSAFMRRMAATAAAAMLLNGSFYATAPAAFAATPSSLSISPPISRLPSTPSGNPKANTLLSVVILNTFQNNIHEDIKVRVKVNGKTIETLTTQRGFFHLDLSEIAQPDDEIEVYVKQQKFEAKFAGEYEYAARSYTFRLSEGQNLRLEVEEKAPRRYKRMGMVRQL